MISAAAVVVGLTMTASAQAGGKGSSGSKSSSSSKSYSGSYKPSFSYKSYDKVHHDHDFKFDKNHFLKGDYHCYKGKYCNFWNYHCWDSRYGCYLYWNPWYRCYYYWCEPDDCYYPITYCPYHKFVFVKVVTPVIYTTPVVTVVAGPVAAVATTQVAQPAGPAAPAPVPAP
jgi:hypothetical protein